MSLVDLFCAFTVGTVPNNDVGLGQMVSGLNQRGIPLNISNWRERNFSELLFRFGQHRGTIYSLPQTASTRHNSIVTS